MSEPVKTVLPLSKEEICARLGGAPFRVETVEETASTNEDVLLRARAGEAPGLVLAAAGQSGGRGRMGRSFFSPAGFGVYFSLLVPAEDAGTDPSLLTALAAVAVCDAAESLGAGDCRIKWVNDIYRGGKKCCGILAQSVLNPSAPCSGIVLGIGLNVTPPPGGYPQEIQMRAGALFDTPRPFLREALVAAVLCEIHRRRSLPARDFIEEYRKRSFLIGRRVQILRGEECFFATVEGIDETCRLIVRDDAGQTKHLFSGEVSLVL